MSFLDRRFLENRKAYFRQVGLFTLFLFGILSVETLIAGSDVTRAVMVGSIASTGFILFISPYRPVAATRRVLGGYGWAILIAGLASWVSHVLWGNHPTSAIFLLWALETAFVVGLCILAMAMTNTEHPPAAGAAFAIIGTGFDSALLLFLITSILLLVLAQRSIRRYLVDLY